MHRRNGGAATPRGPYLAPIIAAQELLDVTRGQQAVAVAVDGSKRAAHQALPLLRGRLHLRVCTRERSAGCGVSSAGQGAACRGGEGGQQATGNLQRRRWAG